MRKTGILFRFIDLGLVLLMAFLAVAEIQAEAQVQLPGGERVASGRFVFYRLHFDRVMQAHLEQLPEGNVFCRVDELAALGKCMQAAQRSALEKMSQDARFVLSPRDGVILQQLVILLDLCEAEDLVCTIES